MSLEASPNEEVFDQLDESTRLLPGVEHGGTTPSLQATGPTPLPKAQLGALLAVRIIDPIAHTQIFPYINQLLADLRIATPEQVGFYSGFIESAYALPQVISVYQWGRLSDIVGRRPIVLFCLFGIAVATIAFGLSTSLITIVASRFLCGVVAGNIAVHHSILIEITDDSNQNIAVPIYSLSWSTGSIIGSLIGGTFANAATRYPKYFSWPVFIDYPYLPPCLITALCTLLGIFMGYFLIEETLPSKRKSVADNHVGRTPHSVSDADVSSGSVSAKEILAIPAIWALTLSGLVLSFLSSSFDVVFALFCYMPVDGGGLGLEPSTIGNFLASAGIFAVLLRLVAMPYILRRFDYATTYKTCMYIWPVVFALLPLFNMLALARPPPRSESCRVSGIEIVIRIGLAFALALARLAALPYSVTMLLVKRYVLPQSTPTPGFEPVEINSTRSDHRSTSALSAVTVGSNGTVPPTMKKGNSASLLGRSNGLVQLVMCLGRSVGPIVVSTLFTALNGSPWARRWGIGWTWSFVMVCFSVVGTKVSKRIQ